MILKGAICLVRGHISSDWVPHYWAPGHSWGEWRYCKRCQKKLDYKAPNLPILEDWMKTSIK